MIYTLVRRRAALAALLLSSLAGWPAFAATWVVDTAVDAVDANLGDQDCLTAANTCSLRAAIQQANAKPGLDEIHLPAGTFSLSIAGAGENAAATGDLDVTDDVTLVGAGEGLTVIDAAGLDRVFESHPPAVAPVGLTLWLVTLTVQGGAVSGQNDDGGCFRNPENGVLLIDRVTVRDCRGLHFGGAVYNAGRFEAVDSSLIGNGDPTFSTGMGGAVANVGAAGEVYILLSELRDNIALAGGAIYTSADFINPHTSEVRIEQSSLIGNRAGQRGGGIDNNSLTHVFVQDSTLAGNEAGSGGGLANDGGGLYLIRNSTIAFNHANNIGGGIEEVHFDPDFIRIRNSVIAYNTAANTGPDCHFRISSEAATLIGNTTGCELTGGSGNLLNVDPKLGPLLKLGARAWAFLPLPGSPVIDTGATALCSERDQLGTVRPFDGNGDGQPFCDLGAIEAGPQLFASGFETGDLAEWSFTLP